VACLILRGAVVAGAGETGVGGLIDLTEVEGEVGGEVGVGGVDSAIQNGDAGAFAHGGVPGAVCGATGDVVSVAADLTTCPALWGGVEGVVRLGGWRGWRWRSGNGGGVGCVLGAGDGADGVQVDRAGDDGEVRACGWCEDEAAGGDDAVVEDVFDVGLGGEAVEGGGVVCGGVDHGEAEVIVALKEMGSGDAGADFGVAGDGGVAIDDEVAMRDDGAGIELG
jgi:hypothetical protein